MGQMKVVKTFLLIFVSNVIRCDVSLSEQKLNKNLDCSSVPKLDVLPGFGMDMIRVKEMAPVIQFTYNECKMTNDKRYLIPDQAYVITQKTSNLEIFSELLENLNDYKSLDSRNIEIEASTGLFDITGKFSSGFQAMKRHQIDDKTVTTRIAARYTMYKVGIHIPGNLTHELKSMFDDILVASKENNLGKIDLLAELIIRDYGTHVTTVIEAGGIIAKEDFLFKSYVDSFSGEKQNITAQASGSFFGSFNIKGRYNQVSEVNVTTTYTKNTASSHVSSFGGTFFKPNMSVDDWIDTVKDNLVSTDKIGIPLEYLIRPESFPGVSLDDLSLLEKEISDAIARYVCYNRIAGCTNPNSENFDYSANVEKACTDPYNNYTFGGMYQTCKKEDPFWPFIPSIPCQLNQKNFATGDYTCPKNYAPVLLKTGSVQVPYQSKVEECHSSWIFFEHCDSFYRTEYSKQYYETYWCSAIDGVPIALNSGIMFGGIFTSKVDNLFTHGQSCPPSFLQVKVLQDLNVCVSVDYEVGQKFSVKLGGFFSCENGNPLVDILTQQTEASSLTSEYFKFFTNEFSLAFDSKYKKTCPKGYSQHTAVVIDDCYVMYCVEAGAFGTHFEKPIVLPPFQNISVLYSHGNKTLLSTPLTHQLNIRWFSNVIGIAVGFSILMSSFTNTSGNVLDLVYTDNPELCMVTQAEFRMLPPLKSDIDHVPLSCTVECCPSIASTSADENNLVYCFRKANYDDINTYLSSIDLVQLSAIDVNESVTSLYASIYETFDKFVPRASIRSSNNPSWYTKEMLCLKNIRNKEFKKLSTLRREQLINAIPTVLDDRKFLQAKHEYEALRTKLHSDYIRDKSHCLKTDPKSFWRYINSKRKSNRLPAVVEWDGKKATTNAEKSNLFAEYFQSVYVEHPEDPSLLDFINERNDDDCYDIKSPKELVHFVLRGLDVNKGSGHDGVSSFFLRECADSLAEPLSCVYTQSLSEKSYPDAFKIGQLTPVYKSGRKNDVTNYRGVNVMPNLAKVFERVVYLQLKLIIPRNIKISQHAFLPNRNIESNLMELNVAVHDAFDQNAQLDTYEVDISKAFDKVETAKLIRKMATFPLSNTVLFWFVSYFASRVQYVYIGTDKSQIIIVLSGIGQGSILGVFSFLMFFNDSDVIMECILCLNFADDKRIGRIIKSVEDAIKLQSAINQFFNWCCDNGLEINRNKSKIMTYTMKTKPIIFDYVLDGKTIERTDSTFTLGILMNKKMNFISHYEYVSNKSRSVLNFVMRQRPYLDDSAITIIYKALVRSNLEFASCIWTPDYETHRRTIESTQKQFVMFLNGDYRNRADNDYVLSPYVERCAKFNLQSLIRRRTNACILFIHSLITGKINSPALRSRIMLNRRFTIHNGLIFTTKGRTIRSYCSPFRIACRMFNAITDIIDPTLPHKEFRNALFQVPDSMLSRFLEM